MMEWFLDGGVMMWPLLALALGVVGLAARAAVRLRRRHAPPPSLGTILFWGAVAMLMGALGTAVGLVVMARHIAAAGGAAAPQLIWSGVSVALITLIFGILIFLLSGFLWLALDAWSRRLPNPPLASDV